jgi:L-glyceraldehyde reductase
MNVASIQHWPVAFVPEGDLAENLFPAGEATGDVKQVKLDLETTLVDTWKAMIKLKDTGKVKHIGVSNFTVEAVSAWTAHARMRLLHGLTEFVLRV